MTLCRCNANGLQWLLRTSHCYGTIIVVVLLHSAHAAVYIQNETYPSLPALFGRYMADNRLYHARLQFLPENPYLCERFDSNATHFVPTRPTPLTTTNTVYRNSNNNDSDEDENGNNENIEYQQNNDLVLPAESIVLLASRGNCPFARKAAVAESIHPSVQFLIVYNYDLEGEDTLVPMYTEYGDTRLILLSVTHRAGQALRQYIAEQPEAVRQQQGGPVIAMDSQPPPGMLTTEDLQEMMLSAIGLFFLLVSFSGCVMILVGTFGQLQGNSGGTIFSAGPITRARLTEAHVLQLPSVAPDTDSASETSRTTTEDAAHDGDDEDGTLSCAICLDDEVSTAWTVLPCHHQFHTECIVPWLTERQAKCPLCKYDVLQHILEHEAAVAVQQPGPHGFLGSLWMRVTRYRWTQVNSHVTDEDDENNGNDEERLHNRRHERDVSIIDEAVEMTDQSQSSSLSPSPLQPPFSPSSSSQHQQ